MIHTIVMNQLLTSHRESPIDRAESKLVQHGVIWLFGRQLYFGNDPSRRRCWRLFLVVCSTRSVFPFKKLLIIPDPGLDGCSLSLIYSSAQHTEINSKKITLTGRCADNCTRSLEIFDLKPYSSMCTVVLILILQDHLAGNNHR